MIFIIEYNFKVQFSSTNSPVTRLKNIFKKANFFNYTKPVDSENNSMTFCRMTYLATAILKPYKQVLIFFLHVPCEMIQLLYEKFLSRIISDSSYQYWHPRQCVNTVKSRLRFIFKAGNFKSKVQVDKSTATCPLREKIKLCIIEKIQIHT